MTNRSLFESNIKFEKVNVQVLHKDNNQIHTEGKKRVLFAGKLYLIKFLKVGLALDFEFHGLGNPLELEYCNCLTLYTN